MLSKPPPVPPEIATAATRTFGGAPALLSRSGTTILYLPFIAKAETAPTVDLSITKVEVIQGSTLSSTYSVYIANRATTVRAYVSVSGATSVSGVYGRLYCYYGSSYIGSYDSNIITALASNNDTNVAQQSMDATLNFYLDPTSICSSPGYSYYVQVDPGTLVPETNEANNVYPTDGSRLAFNFQSVSPLQVVIVPIQYLPYGATNSTQPNLSNMTNLLWMAEAVFPIPVPLTNYTIHSTVEYNPSSENDNLYDPDWVYDGQAWQDLLDQITALHNSEDSSGTKIYYGIVNTHDAHGCGSTSACITGLGWLGLPTAIGWSGNPDGSSGEGETLAHELGHTFNRDHVDCRGDEDYPDTNYPYADGLIGVWGLDVQNQLGSYNPLYNPAYTGDYMSYCSNVWTSDYTFYNIKSYRNTSAYSLSRSGRQTANALYVSGSVSPTGTVTLRPIYQQAAPLTLLSSGTHTLELLDASGKVLASYPFSPSRIADGRSHGIAGFGFYVPAVDGLAGVRVRTGGRSVGEKIVATAMATTNFGDQAPTRRIQGTRSILQWAPATHPTQPVVYRVRISRDSGATWQVLALDLRTPQFTVPAGVNLTNALVEIQASDGIHVTTRTVKP